MGFMNTVCGETGRGAVNACGFSSRHFHKDKAAAAVVILIIIIMIIIIAIKKVNNYKMRAPTVVIV